MKHSASERFYQALSASRAMGTVHLMIFVPSVDRAGRKLRRDWTKPTLDAVGRLFRGGTAYPRGLGVWRDDAAGGRLVYDDTTIVFSYVDPHDLGAGELAELRRFLHRMGREANQGEIGLVVDGRYIGITTYEEK